MSATSLVLSIMLPTLSALPVVVAQETGRSSFTLVSASEGADYIWREEGQTLRNPTLVVTPNVEITIIAKKGDDELGIPHNLRVGPEGSPTSDIFAEPGESITYTFSAPASGTLEYICLIHSTTMKGTVRVAGTSVDKGGEEAPGLTVLTLALALGVAVALARRRTR